MATTPLTELERDEMKLHIEDLTMIMEAPAACDVANKCLELYELYAWNRPGGSSEADVCSPAPEGSRLTLILPEKNALMGQIVAVAAIEGPAGIAADAANEMLTLYEERIQNLPAEHRGQRDVRIAQEHPFTPGITPEP